MQRVVAAAVFAALHKFVLLHRQFGEHSILIEVADNDAATQMKFRAFSLDAPLDRQKLEPAAVL